MPPPVEKVKKLDKPGARTTGGRYKFPMDDCSSAAVNEDPVLRELQRRVEDFAAALMLRIGS